MASQQGGQTIVAISAERLTTRELKCFLCGDTLGEVITSAAKKIFRPAAGCPPLADRRLHQMRCPRCGGPVYLEGAETRTPWRSIRAAATGEERN